MAKATTAAASQYRRCCGGGTVDSSRLISGEPSPILSRVSAAPTSATPIQSMPPFTSMRGSPANPHNVTQKIVKMTQNPACGVDRSYDPERKSPLLGRKQIGDQRHADRNHRSRTERLDDTADNQRIQRCQIGR